MILLYQNINVLINLYPFPVLLLVLLGYAFLLAVRVKMQKLSIEHEKQVANATAVNKTVAAGSEDSDNIEVKEAPSEKDKVVKLLVT